MTASEWYIYDEFLEQLGNGLHDFSNDTLKVSLHTSSYVPDTETDTSQSSLGNEVSGSGYSSGGNSVGNTSWSVSSGEATLNGDDVTFTADGGSITCRTAVLFNASAGGSNDVIAYTVLDSSPADVEAEDGESLIIQIDELGLFSLEQVIEV